MNNFINIQFSGDALVSDVIYFNNVVANNGFTYNNGTFTVNNSGDYIIVYHINIEGSVSTTDIMISLLRNGINYHTTIGNALVGQFSGSTAIHLNKGDTLSLINTTGEIIEITFANIIIYGGEITNAMR